MKKYDFFEGVVEVVNFPNRGYVTVEGERIRLKNVLPGQKIKGQLCKKRRSQLDGRVVEILEKAPYEIDPSCPVFGVCGGCLYQQMPYEEQLKLKTKQVRDLLDELAVPYEFDGIKGSPEIQGYRNKMEYSFGDPFKEGPLTVGMHKRGGMHDIVEASTCTIVHNDFNLIVAATQKYFREAGLPFYKKMSHEGYLRFLVVRRGVQTGEIQINLVTSTQLSPDLTPWVEVIQALPLENKISGILNTLNDTLSDAIKPDAINVLAGDLFFYEKILGLTFKISPFSFFQTNSLGAEVLYDAVRHYVGDTQDKVVFDLYSGTGTITQLMSPIAKRAVGVEIVEEAVEAARMNAAFNNLDHCEFIAGDVLTALDDVEGIPDMIILDPPREGIHPKALEKIIAYGVDSIVYVSCKPTSLVADLRTFLEKGYVVERVQLVDMFPSTVHVESVIKMTYCGLKDKK